jgi:hypothetical protein
MRRDTSIGWFAFNPKKSHILRSGTDWGFVIALHDEINGFLSACSGSKPLHCIGFNILSGSITCNNTGQFYLLTTEQSVNGRRLQTRRRRKDLLGRSHEKGLKKIMKNSCMKGIIGTPEQMGKTSAF